MAEELVQESFEGIRIESRWLFLFMESPELSVVSILDKLVDLIVRLGADERWSSIVHDKENYTSSEKISLKATVFALLHLWGLIAFSSYSRVQLAILVMAFSKSR